MKKLILTSVCLIAISGVAFGQGKVTWSTVNPSAMTAQTNSTVYSPLYGGGSANGGAIGATAASAGQFYYELLYSAFSGSQVTQPSSLAALSAWSDAGLSAVNNGSSAGRLSVSGTTGTSVAVPWASGTTQSVMLVGWSANLGTTWSQTLAVLNSPSLLGSVVGSAFFGMSNTGYIAPNAADPGVAVFGAGQLAGVGLLINSPNTQLYLVPVPEPGTMALAALGGASLLLFRRRK